MTTMDGRTLLISIDQIPSPGSVKVIKGEGMITRDDTCVGTQKSGESSSSSSSSSSESSESDDEVSEALLWFKWSLEYVYVLI